MADEYRRYPSRPGGCPAYEKNSEVSEVLRFLIRIWEQGSKHLLHVC